MGSNDMTRGFGKVKGAISMSSWKFTFLSHVVVGDIVVGRVIVDVIM
jgi:hypothetical protein